MAGELDIVNADGSYGGTASVDIGGFDGGWGGMADASGSTVVAAPVVSLLNPRGALIGFVSVPDGTPEFSGFPGGYFMKESQLPGAVGIYDGNDNGVGLIDINEPGMLGPAIPGMQADITPLTADLIGQSAVTLQTAYGGLLAEQNAGAFSSWVNNSVVPSIMGYNPYADCRSGPA